MRTSTRSDCDSSITYANPRSTSTGRRNSGTPLDEQQRERLPDATVDLHQRVPRRQRLECGERPHQRFRRIEAADVEVGRVLIVFRNIAGRRDLILDCAPALALAIAGSPEPDRPIVGRVGLRLVHEAALAQHREERNGLEGRPEMKYTLVAERAHCAHDPREWLAPRPEVFPHVQLDDRR